VKTYLANHPRHEIDAEASHGEESKDEKRIKEVDPFVKSAEVLEK